MQRIILPKPRSAPDMHSCNLVGSFRGIVTAWGELGLVEIEQSANPFVWWNAIGDVLLYDRPTLEWLTERVPYRAALFGNPDPPANGRINLPWIFWPRWPNVFEQYRQCKALPLERRDIQCFFAGSYENFAQRQYRPLNYWRACCDFFDASGSRKGTVSQHYTNREYARVLRRARYGLCLRGYGPKCHREVECMALGTVPIFTPGVSVHYYDAPRLGIHYLFAETPEQVRDVMARTSSDQWRDMSEAGREWYRRNVSPQGAFETTQRIVEGLKLEGLNRRDAEAQR
jgi:hypothetical protein